MIEQEEQEEIEEKKISWNDKFYMLHENEMWLNEQAKKGLILKHFNDDEAYFNEMDEQNINYKIIVLNKENAENQIKIIERQGFTFVGRYFEYYIFSINGKYGHIRPRLNTEAIKFARKWFNKQLIKRVALSLLFLVPIVINIIFDWDKLLQNIAEMPTIWYVILGFGYILIMIEAIREYRSVIKAKKCFLEHEEYLVGRNLRKSAIMKPLIILICIFVGISIIKAFYFDVNKYSINEVQKTMPIVLIDDIDPQEALSGELLDTQKNIDEDNYAEIRHTLIAPNQYQAWQKNAENGMVIFYYEVSVSVLAEPLARELPINNLVYIEKEELHKIDYEGLDAVYFSEEGYMPVVSACKGKRVMCILFDRNLKVEDILSEMVEVL